MDIKLTSSFEEILGKNANFYTESERKLRWKKWQEIASNSGESELLEYWNNKEACIGCIHLNLKDNWCNKVGLPSSVNPIVSFRCGIIGMACMGTCYEKIGQQELNFI